MRVLAKAQTPRIDVAAFDIEGFEYRVLKRYSTEVRRDDLPRRIFFEHNTALVSRAGGDVRVLLGSYGYRVRHVWDQNYWAEL